MAEAITFDDTNPTMFYCHTCNVRFMSVESNYTCPHCFGGFIEEVDANSDNNPERLFYMDDDEDESYNALMDFADLFPSNAGPEYRRPRRHQRQESRRRRSLTRRASSTVRHHGLPFENIIQEVILNLGVGVDWPGGGNMQLFLGNPGDYAWGREGLDAIVTQLLNQMDGSGVLGPPPLTKEAINALPVVEVTPQQADGNLQCSVCWEDFILKESVRQLPCQHIYHEDCIRPWLQLHGTCPICRQSPSAESNQASPNSVTENNPYEALEQLFSNASQRSDSPSSTIATRGSDSPASSTSSSSTKDGRM